MIDEMTVPRFPLAIAAFRRIWIGATISAAGDAASWVALVALVAGRPHGSVAVLAVLYTAPVAVGGLVAGWALDRYHRRGLLAADSLLRAMVFASVPVAALSGALSVAQLYLIAAVYGLLKMISLAGFPALIPSLVPPEALLAANALESVSFGIAGLVGALASAVVVATVGPVYVVAFDAVSYLVFAVCLLSVRGAPRTLQGGRRTGRGGASRTGTGRGGAGLTPVLRLLARDRVLRDTTVMFALFNIGEGALFVVLPRRAFDYGLGAGGYGYLVAAATAGELLAALILTRARTRSGRRASLGRAIVAASLVAAAAVLVLLAPSPWPALAGLVVLGGCAAAMTTWAQTLRMAAAPAASHGRLFGLLRTLMQATPPAGAALAAVTLRHGMTMTLLVVCAVMAAPALAFARDLSSAQPPAAPDGPPADAPAGPPAGEAAGPPGERVDAASRAG